MAKLRLLILSSYNIGDLTSGQGLILSHFVSTLLSFTDIDLSLGKFRCLPRELNNSSLLEDHDSYVNELFSVNGSPISRVTMLRSIVGLVDDTLESVFLNKVQQLSLKFDLAIWFGSAYDPVNLKLPSFCRCPIIFHLNDSISLYQQRLKSKRFIKLRVIMAEHLEKKLLTAGYAKIIYVSYEDFQAGLKLCQYLEKDRLVFLPNGVDDKHFKPRTEITSKRKIRLLFAGVMCYQPNIDAVIYLLHNIIPNLDEDFELRIAGRDPTLEIIEAAENDSRIVVTGTVEDMAWEYQEADIFLAPMISGAGIQNKILQALACGLPVITTSICVDAFGEFPAGCLVANSPDKMVEAIKSLILNETMRIEIGMMGRKFIENNWSWRHRTDVLINIMTDVVGK